MLIEFIRDMMFGVRLLRRTPGFTAVAVLSLGLGIGGATAVFTLVNAIVLRRLPVPEPREPACSCLPSCRRLFTSYSPGSG